MLDPRKIFPSINNWHNDNNFPSLNNFRTYMITPKSSDCISYFAKDI